MEIRILETCAIMSLIAFQYVKKGFSDEIGGDFTNVI